MISPKSDLPQGTLDLLILKTVAALGPVHGYAIAQRLQQISRDVVQVPVQVSGGSLYPALYRLENRKPLVAERGQTETGREAKFYCLTRSRRARLPVDLANWQKLSEAVGLIPGMAEGGTR
jgi:PadR family transcriptional regulator PadR